MMRDPLGLQLLHLHCWTACVLTWPHSHRVLLFLGLGDGGLVWPSLSFSAAET